MATIEKMRPVRFTFDGMVGPFGGFTDGSTWNGFLNIWVTAEEHEKVLQGFRDSNMEGEDDLALATLDRSDDGLYSYANGFITCEHEDEDNPTPYQEWVNGREQRDDLGEIDGLEGAEGFIYPDGSWIEARKGPDGWDWEYYTIVGNQEFSSAHLGTVEWWLWQAWSKSQTEDSDDRLDNGPMQRTLTARRIASEFSRQLREALTETEMTLVIRRNKHETDKNVCHSHDFCDANTVMDAAFRTLGIPTVTDLAEDDEDGRNRATDLWNSAWDIAKATHFVKQPPKASEDEEFIRKVVLSASDAFWATVAACYPRSDTGDFPPDADIAWIEAATTAVRTWVQYNADDVS